MADPHFTILDIAVAVGLGVSGYFAYKRGLLREVLALGSWVLASVLTLTFYPMAKPWVNEQISNEMAADAATALGLFCLIIVILAPLSNYLIGLLKHPTLTSIDHSLGFVFGVLRAFVILSLFYMCLTWVWPADHEDREQPKWLAKARSQPLLHYGSELLQSMAPKDKRIAAEESMRKAREATEDAMEDAEKLEEISVPVPTSKIKETPLTTYGNESRGKLKDIIDRNLSR